MKKNAYQQIVVTVTASQRNFREKLNTNIKNNDNNLNLYYLFAKNAEHLFGLGRKLIC